MISDRFFEDCFGKDIWEKIPDADLIKELIRRSRENETTWRKAWSKMDSELDTEDWHKASASLYDKINKMDVFSKIATSRSFDHISDLLDNAASSSLSEDDLSDYSAFFAVIAIIADEKAKAHLSSNPEHIRLLAVLGDPTATLIYPACIAMWKEKNVKN